MRKLFIGALMISGLGMMFTSCDNGLYDNNPKTDSSFIYNPDNEANGIGTFIGTMKGTFKGKKTKDTNGVLINFYPVAYVEQAPARSIFGVKPEDTINNYTLELTFLDFKGKGVIDMDQNTSDPLFYFSYFDTSEKVRVYYAPTTNRGRARIEVKGNEKNTMWGTFEGVLFRSYPLKNDKDSVIVTKGAFYVPKSDI